MCTPPLLTKPKIWYKTPIQTDTLGNMFLCDIKKASYILTTPSRMRSSVSERPSRWAPCPYRYLQMPQSKCAKLLFLGHLSRSIQRRQSISRGREQDSNSDGNGHGMEISWPSFARLLHNQGARNHHHAQQSQFHQLITFGNNPHLPSHAKKYSILNLLASVLWYWKAHYRACPWIFKWKLDMKIHIASYLVIRMSAPLAAQGTHRAHTGHT